LLTAKQAEGAKKRNINISFQYKFPTQIKKTAEAAKGANFFSGEK